MQIRETFEPPLFDQFLQPIYNLSSVDPEWNMTTTQIIQYHGYPAEEHTVVTTDGYIITVHRIPYGKKKYSGELRNPIILQHGLLATSSSWVLNIPRKNFAYKLADAGYDVWLTNVRGTTYGMKHLTLSQYDEKFWKYSFHEMAIYDMTAMVDYILETTKSKQLDYVGHSMGTAILTVMLSTVPEYNQKVRIAVLLAPALSLRYTTIFIRELEELIPIVELMEGLVLPLNYPVMRYAVGQLCQTRAKTLCHLIVLVIIGVNHNHHNWTRFPVYASHFPDATSFQTFLHYIQLRSKTFQMYDYGKERNYKVYGQCHPPEYELKKISTPIVIMWSEYDMFSNAADIADYLTHFPSLMYEYKIPSERFSHVDYILADNADKLVYNKIMQFLDEATKS